MAVAARPRASRTSRTYAELGQRERWPPPSKGLEIGIQKYADFLPKPWSGFGIDANYTYIDSRQPGAIAYDMLGKAINNLPVTGLSKNTINLTVMYDNGPLSRCASPTTGVTTTW